MRRLIRGFSEAFVNLKKTPILTFDSNFNVHSLFCEGCNKKMCFENLVSGNLNFGEKPWFLPLLKKYKKGCFTL